MMKFLTAIGPTLGSNGHIGANQLIFVFNVLPFCMSTAPYIFTKVLKPVINYWRSACKIICMFLDDGLGGNTCKESASTDAIAVRADLAKLGFLLSVDKCVWDPSLRQSPTSYQISRNLILVTFSLPLFVFLSSAAVSFPI